MIGPLLVKGLLLIELPLLRLSISLGYENTARLNTAISFNTFVTYCSNGVAATNSFVSDKGSSDNSRKATHMLLKTMVCCSSSALTQIENVTATIIAEKGLRRNISRKRATLINKLSILVATYELYMLVGDIPYVARGYTGSGIYSSYLISGQQCHSTTPHQPNTTISNGGSSNGGSGSSSRLIFLIQYLDLLVLIHRPKRCLVWALGSFSLINAF